MVQAALTFLAGVLLLLRLPEPPAPAWWWLLAPAAVAAWRWPLFRIPVFLLVGAAWAAWHAQLRLDDRLPAVLAGDAMHVAGRIASIPESRSTGVRFLFAPDEASRQRPAGRLPSLLRLSWYHPEQVPQAGERWRLIVRLRQPRGFMNPGGFDYEAWLFQRGIGATGYVRAPQRAVRIAPAPRFSLPALRATIARDINATLAGNPFAPLVAGLAVGYRNDITDAQWDVLRGTGTSHLMAISGLHVGMVAGLAFFLGQWLCRRFVRLSGRLPAPVIAAVIALLAAALYAALAGFSVPTRRALIMLSVVLGALMLRRPLPPWRALAAALLTVLVLDPLAVLGAGFWLSFGAVAVIAYALGWRRFPPHPGSVVTGKLAALWRVQCAVVLGLAPLTLLFFKHIPAASLAANLVAIPVFSFLVVPLVLAGMALPGSLGEGCWELAAAVIGGCWIFLEALNDWLPRFSPVVSTWPALLAAGLGVALLLTPRGVPGRWLGLVMFLPLAFGSPDGPSHGAYRFTLLDVGQGLAAVVETRRHVLVYDTGPAFASGSDTGSLVVLPFLKARGLVPDRLVVSHGDRDHAGGAASLLAAYPGLPVSSGQPRRLALPGTTPCRAGQSWHWDGVRFEFLYPAAAAAAASGQRHNDASCVLRIEGGGGSVLLTGDIEAAAERRLLAADRALASDVMLVPHHGSATSSTPALLEAIAPDYALVSAGHANRWGFPKPEVRARYAAAGIRLLDTAASGAISFEVDGEGVRLRGRHRPDSPRIWRAE